MSTGKKLSKNHKKIAIYPQILARKYRKSQVKNTDTRMGSRIFVHEAGLEGLT